VHGLLLIKQSLKGSSPFNKLHGRATAKQKAKYVSRMVVRAKELRAVITKYNSVVVHFPESGYTATSFDERSRVASSNGLSLVQEIISPHAIYVVV